MHRSASQRPSRAGPSTSRGVVDAPVGLPVERRREGGPGSPEAGRRIGRSRGVETSGRGLVYLVFLYYSSAMIDGMISTAGPQPGGRTAECVGFG